MSDSNQIFDLTTKEGRARALVIAEFVFPAAIPLAWLGKTLNETKGKV